MKNPRRIIMESSYDQKVLIDKDDPFVSAKSLFPMQNDNGSLVLDTSHFDGESSDQDLLLDVPSNGSFPQAELLPTSSFGALASTSSSSVYPSLVHPWWHLSNPFISVITRGHFRNFCLNLGGCVLRVFSI